MTFLFSLFLFTASIYASESKFNLVNIPGAQSKNILSVTTDQDNFIWVGTDQGLIQFDGIESDIFRSNPFSTTSLSGNRIWFLDNYSNDTLIVISDEAIHLYSKKSYQFEKFKIGSRPTNYFKEDGEIWITTLSSGVYKLDKNKILASFKFEPLNPFSISSSNFESINGNKFAKDSSGSVWLATSSGLNQILSDNSVRRYFKSNTDDQLLSENIISLHLTSDDVLLVGTNSGLNYYSLEEKSFLKKVDLVGKSIQGFKKVEDKLLIFTKSNTYSLSNEEISFESKNNGFSFGIQNNKSTVLWKKGTSTISFNDTNIDLKKDVNSVTKFRDGLLFGTNDGLMNIISRDFFVTKSNYQTSIKERIDFIGYYNDQRSNDIKIKSFDAYGFKDQFLWFLSYGKIGRINLKNNDRDIYEYNPRNPNSFPKNISSFLIKDNHIWVGSSETGLYKYDIETLNLINHYQFNIDDPTSLQTSLVTSLVLMDDNIYVGSGGDGLFKFQSSTNGFIKSDVNMGLSSDIINKLFVFDGVLFVNTQQGLNYLAPGDNYFKSIDRDDGLNISNFDELRFSKVNRKLIVEGNNSQFSIDVSALKLFKSQAKPVIKRISGVDSRNNEHLLPFINNKVNVPPFITSLTIMVSFPSIYKTKQNLYSYSFGSSSDRESLTRKAGESILISKIGYSDKVLKIKSLGSNELHAGINFNYIPPWYFTWWAITSYAVFAIGGIYVFTTIRARKLQQQMEESRKSEELEEARNLQLQLLAKKVPEMKNVEVETYIRTATEVGGDYYDFFELDDGTLIAACGDATGHGATSGMMVSITKAGLKGIEKRSPNEMLTDLNNIVKSVEIGRIRMSLNLLEFKNGHVNISSAAMPPVYHYSKKTDSVNEIELVGTPLGSFYDEEFDRYQVDFEDGDALVLMSDGLPEAPNHDGEMLDYPAVKECIKANGSKSASGIKDSLIELSDKWLDGIQNPDDITLVIFKKNKDKEFAQA